MNFGSYRTVYGGQPRMVQQPSGQWTGSTNPWLLEPGTSMAHRLKLVPANRPAQAAGNIRSQVPVVPPPKHRMPPPPPVARRISPAGQASSSGPSPWAVLTLVGVGFVGYELIKYSLHRYVR